MNGGGRSRSNSVKAIIAYVQTPPVSHHLLHLESRGDDVDDRPTPLPAPEQPRPRKKTTLKRTQYGPSYLQWVSSPGDSFVILASIVSLWAAWEIFFPKASPEVPSGTTNPFSAFLFISYPLPPDAVTGEVRYAKGLKDLLFLPFWIVAFSFLRQAITQYVVKAVGIKLGVKKGRRLERFMEQGYAVVYFGTSSAFGLYVMSKQDSWWYQTEHFWLDYPNHWAMTGMVKTYYLTQFAYWLQQALVMIAGLEKPRDDYVELILHHVITLYLVGVSYSVNLTQIGIAIFVSMDVPDLLLAISKCINYVGLEMTGNCSFVVFMFTWGYLRHYQNIRILSSVWTEFKLVPLYARVWDPAAGFFLPPLMRFQIFLPIFLLQLVIGFWSFLILRIVTRMFMGRPATDVREDGETETEGGASEVEGKKSTRARKNAERGMTKKNR